MLLFNLNCYKLLGLLQVLNSMIILFLYCVWFFSSNNPKRNNLERNKNVKGILKNNYKSNTYTCSIVVKWGTNFSFILTLHVYMFLLMIKYKNCSKLYIPRKVNDDTKIVMFTKLI